MDIEDWRLYVRALAQRYGARVRYWELWNEPDYAGFWAGAPEQLAMLARVAREEIKRANPDAWLVGPAVTGLGIGFLDRFLAAGGGMALDAVSFHAYAMPRSDDVLATIANVRLVLASYGLEKLPLWNSEAGISCDLPTESCTSAPQRSSAAIDMLAPRALFLMAAEGLFGTVFYTWERHPPDAVVGLSNPPNYQSLTLAGEAYRRAADVLAGARIEDAFESQDIFVIRFQSSSGEKVALWTESGDKAIVVPRSWPYARYHFIDRDEVALSTEGAVSLRPGIVLVGDEH